MLRSSFQFVIPKELKELVTANKAEFSISYQPRQSPNGEIEIIKSVHLVLKTKNGGQAFTTFDGGRDDIENFPNLFKKYIQQYKEEL